MHARTRKRVATASFRAQAFPPFAKFLFRSLRDIVNARSSKVHCNIKKKSREFEIISITNKLNYLVSYVSEKVK